MAKASKESLCPGNTCRRKSCPAGEVSQSLLATPEKEDSPIVGATWWFILLGFKKLSDFFTFWILEKVSRQGSLRKPVCGGRNRSGATLWRTVAQDSTRRGPFKAFPVYPGPFWGVGSYSGTVPYPILLEYETKTGYGAFRKVICSLHCA